VVQGLPHTHARALHPQQQLPHKVLARVRDRAPLGRRKLDTALQNARGRLAVIDAPERRQAAQDHVREHAHRPHVSGEAHRLPLDDLGRRELDAGRRHSDQLVRVQPARQAEVYYLDVLAASRLEHDVLGLEVQVNDVVLVHVLQALQDLADVSLSLGLCHFVRVEWFISLFMNKARTGVILQRLDVSCGRFRLSFFGFWVWVWVWYLFFFGFLGLGLGLGFGFGICFFGFLGSGSV